MTTTNPEFSFLELLASIEGTNLPLLEQLVEAIHMDDATVRSRLAAEEQQQQQSASKLDTTLPDDVKEKCGTADIEELREIVSQLMRFRSRVVGSLKQCDRHGLKVPESLRLAISMPMVLHEDLLHSTVHGSRNLNTPEPGAVATPTRALAPSETLPSVDHSKVSVGFAPTSPQLSPVKSANNNPNNTSTNTSRQNQSAAVAAATSPTRSRVDGTLFVTGIGEHESQVSLESPSAAVYSAHLQKAFACKRQGDRRSELSNLLLALAAIKTAPNPDPMAACRLLRFISDTHLALHDHQAASDYMFDCYLIASKLGDHATSQRALTSMGHLAHLRGDLAGAEKWLSQADSLGR